MTRKGAFGATNNCPRGVLAHLTRREAKQHAVRHQQEYGDHVRPYACPDCGFWHIGQLSAAVVRGQRTARQVYPRRTG